MLYVFVSWDVNSSEEPNGGPAQVGLRHAKVVYLLLVGLLHTTFDP